jgi:hypothetical protein
VERGNAGALFPHSAASIKSSTFYYLFIYLFIFPLLIPSLCSSLFIYLFIYLGDERWKRMNQGH